jgi:hypothetical protein
MIKRENTAETFKTIEIFQVGKEFKLIRVDAKLFGKELLRTWTDDRDSWREKCR